MRKKKEMKCEIEEREGNGRKRRQVMEMERKGREGM